MTPKTTVPSPAPAWREIATGDLDNGVPCAGCGQLPATPPEAGIVWTCPYCGSADLRVFYDERRACRIGTLNDTGDPADAAPWPSYAGDEFVDIDPGSFIFHCDACNTHGITPGSVRTRNAIGLWRASACGVARLGSLYAACSTAHTSPHRSTKSRRWSARETVSFRWWRYRRWSRSSSWAVQKRAAASKEPKPRMG